MGHENIYVKNLYKIALEPNARCDRGCLVMRHRWICSMTYGAFQDKSTGSKTPYLSYFDNNNCIG